MSSRLRIPFLSSRSRSCSALPPSRTTQYSGDYNTPPPPPYERHTRSHPDNESEKDTKDSEDFFDGSDEEKYKAKRKAAEERELLSMLPILAQYDSVIVVDDSDSMNDPCGYIPEGRRDIPTRWQIAKELIGDIAERLAKYDSDGIDVYFLNNQDVSRTNLKSRHEVETLFDHVYPYGMTPTGRRLDDLFQQYRDTARIQGLHSLKKMNYIVFTDGDASDPKLLTRSIVGHARWLDSEHCPKNQVGVQFFQVGDDHIAARFLAKLDDDLQQRLGIRDIVDTVKYVGEPLTLWRIVKTCVGGVDKFIDTTNLEAHQ
ncbi:hypothetical protein BC629DRAFT_1595133 [Irpex lacteus]|nr:hypothetical protein BC629DRAFT_1595133 [Irpex lacteus]